MPSWSGHTWYIQYLHVPDALAQLFLNRYSFTTSKIFSHELHWLQSTHLFQKLFDLVKSCSESGKGSFRRSQGKTQGNPHCCQARVPEPSSAINAKENWKMLHSLLPKSNLVTLFHLFLIEIFYRHNKDSLLQQILRTCRIFTASLKLWSQILNQYKQAELYSLVEV